MPLSSPPPENSDAASLAHTHTHRVQWIEHSVAPVTQSRDARPTVTFPVAGEVVGNWSRQFAVRLPRDTHVSGDVIWQEGRDRTLEARFSKCLTIYYTIMPQMRQSYVSRRIYSTSCRLSQQKFEMQIVFKNLTTSYCSRKKTLARILNQYRSLILRRQFTINLKIFFTDASDMMMTADRYAV